MNKTLYWIGTPRHFLIAAGMALEEVHQFNPQLLLTSSQDYVNGIVTVLKEWTGKPFSRVWIIQSPDMKNRVMERLRLVKQISRYRKFARTHQFDHIQVFPATWLPAQAFLYEVKLLYPETKRKMIEDGGIYYNNQPISDIASQSYSRLKLLAGRILYGHAWRSVKAKGIGEVVDEIHLISPEHVRREWASCNLFKLSSSHLHRLANTDLPDIYLRMAGSCVEELKGIELAFILSRSDGIADGLTKYVNAVIDLLRIARKHGLRVGVKYHPKEKEADYMTFKDKSWVVEIPRHIPAELLFIVNPVNLRYVLGDTSTALLGVSWLLPNCRAVSFVDMVSKQPELIYPDFVGLGIELIRDAREFDEMLLND